MTTKKIQNKYEKVKKIILQEQQIGNWPLPYKRRASKKKANTFMIGAIIDYQISAEQAWENAKIISKRLGNPDDILHVISRKSSRSMAKLFEEPPALHKFPKQASERVSKMAKHIVKKYDGDARKIWEKQPTNEIIQRLQEITGPQISRMIRGALSDTKQITGKGDLKADMHVRKVLGRVFLGDDKISGNKALEIANCIVPGNSWSLDNFLYFCGKNVCKPQQPECNKCLLKRQCRYYKISKKHRMIFRAKPVNNST